MSVIELREFERHGPVELPVDVVAVLARMAEVRVEPSRVRAGAWDVVARHHVGVVRIGDLELRIRPKVPYRRLLGWLTETPELINWDTAAANFADTDELLSTITAAFCHHVEQVLRGGLLQGYRTVEESSVAVRGRLLVGTQVARRAGLVLPAEISHDEFTHDVLENQLLAGATRQLMRLGGVPEALAGRLRHLAVHLADVTPTPPSRSVPALTFTRLNERYRAATVLARLILRSTALDDGAERASKGVAFLVDMNRVFEDIVGNRLKVALERIGGKVKLQHEDWLDDDRWMRFRPDLVWFNDDGSHRAVLDIKYSIPKDQSVSSAHVYQVIAYAHRCDVDRVHLVYGMAPPRSHMSIGNITVGLHAIGLDHEPSALHGEVVALCDVISGGLED